MGSKGWFAWGAVALLVACGGDDATGTVDGGGDASTTSSLPPVQVGTVDPADFTRIDPATAVPADFSCVGTLTEPTAGAPITFNMQLVDFETSAAVPNACVRFYADNVIPDDLCDPMTDLVTDATGSITLMDAADSWYAYRVYPRPGATAAMDIVGTVQYNEAAPAMDGRSVEGNSVSNSTFSTIPTVLGFRREAGVGFVAGRIEDCAGANVYGAEIRAYLPDGTRILQATGALGPHFHYFDGADFPSRIQPWSNVDGLYVAVNLPVSATGELIFLELWGRTTVGGPVERIGCERARLFADTVTIINIGPTRSDGPACPGV